MERYRPVDVLGNSITSVFSVGDEVRLGQPQSGYIALRSGKRGEVDYKIEYWMMSREDRLSSIDKFYRD